MERWNDSRGRCWRDLYSSFLSQPSKMLGFFSSRRILPPSVHYPEAPKTLDCRLCRYESRPDLVRIKLILAARGSAVKAAEILIGDHMKSRRTSRHAQQKAWRVGAPTNLVEANRQHPRINAITDHGFESKSLGIDVQFRQPHDSPNLTGWLSCLAPLLEAENKVTAGCVREGCDIAQEFPFIIVGSEGFKLRGIDLREGKIESHGP